MPGLQYMQVFVPAVIKDSITLHLEDNEKHWSWKIKLLVLKRQRRASDHRKPQPLQDGTGISKHVTTNEEMRMAAVSQLTATGISITVDQRFFLIAILEKVKNTTNSKEKKVHAS